MGRERTFKGTDAEVELARFLCRITENHGLDTVAKVAAQFGGSRSKWAEYLNGTSLIPRKLLGEVVTELGRTRPGWSENTVKEATRLWKAAEAGAPLAPDSASAELVSVYRKLTDTTEALHKAELVAVDAAGSISKLLKLGGLLTHKVEHLQEEKRTEAAHHLEQTRFRLSRVEDELQLARSDRYTAEQAQAFLLREQEETLQEVKRLQRAATGLDQTEVEVEPTLLPEQPPEPVMPDEETDRETDERLDLISTNRELRGAMLSEVLQQAHMTPETAEEGRPQTIRGTVITQHTQPPEPAHRPAPPTLDEPVYQLSRTTLDNPATSNDTSIPASSTRPGKRRRVLLAALLVVILGASVPQAYEWMNERSDKASTGGPSSKPGPSSTPTPKPTEDPLPTRSHDQVADIGNTVINTPAIRQLPDCDDQDKDVWKFTWDMKNSPHPLVLGGKAKFRLTLMWDSASSCRVDLGRSALPLYISAENGGNDFNKIWSSVDCAGADATPRWARLDRTHPLEVVYTWDFQRGQTRSSPGGWGCQGYLPGRQRQRRYLRHSRLHLQILGRDKKLSTRRRFLGHPLSRVRHSRLLNRLRAASPRSLSTSVAMPVTMFSMAIPSASAPGTPLAP